MMVMMMMMVVVVMMLMMMMMMMMMFVPDLVTWIQKQLSVRRTESSPKTPNNIYSVLHVRGPQRRGVCVGLTYSTECFI